MPEPLETKLRGLTAPFRGARGQSPAELETRILEYRRLAAHQHLSEVEWGAVDRLRRRLAKLRREGAGI
jgi:hypothetical protein